MLSKIKVPLFWSLLLILDFIMYMQVEVSGGRGKASRVVDKDDSLQKVQTISKNGVGLIWILQHRIYYVIIMCR